MGLITKTDCMSVTVLNQTVRYICHVVDVCSKLHKDFHDSCLFSVSDQLIVGVVLVASDLKTKRKTFLRYGMTIEQYFCVEESLK